MYAYELPSYVVRVKGSWEKIKQVEKKIKVLWEQPQDVLIYIQTTNY